MDNGIFLVSFKFGVIQCTSCNVTQQNVNFTNTAFSQSILKIETSEWEEEIDKIHAHIHMHNSFIFYKVSSGNLSHK